MRDNLTTETPLTRYDDDDAGPEPWRNAPPGPNFFAQRGFFRWGLGIYLLSTAALLSVAFKDTGGRAVFIIDDTAIHLSIAENLAHHATWGVVPGHFQSASSSPLWTCLLALYVLMASAVRSIGLPMSDSTGPFVLNILAGIWVIKLLSTQQDALRPNRRRPLDVLALAALVIGVLFLPALTLLGMEHILQIALVLASVILFERLLSGVPTGWPRWAPYVLLALATLVRFETLFVALGLIAAYAVAVLVERHDPQPETPVARRVRQGVSIALAAMLPFIAFVATNRIMGQGWLPNSVLAKGQGINGSSGNPYRLVLILNRLTTDPLVAALTVIIAGCVLVNWKRRRRSTYLGIVFLVATACQVTFAQIGWFERYQAYLIALGVLVLLRVASESLPARSRPPARSWLVPGLIGISLLLCVTKVSLTQQISREVLDTYEQRYQAGRFLAQYYNNQPVATGELGYISLFHKGPLTDLFGLGDYEVLEARRRSSQDPGKAYWAQLAVERGFKVVAVYPETLLFNTPDNWILVGEWHMHHPTVTALDSTFQFWATVPSEVAPLEQQLRQFQAQMPSGSTLEINSLASYRANKLEHPGG